MMLASNTLISSDVATSELSQRELARLHPSDFQMYVNPKCEFGIHHLLINRYLELVHRYIETNGREGIGRLIIMMPPRHGKSQQATVYYPAWELGKNPDCRIIIASYGFELASDFSREIRDLLFDDLYDNVFGKKSSIDDVVEISSNSRSVKSWRIARHKGGVFAAGVGSGISGKGTKLLIIDDPFKDREDAESQARREKVWEWWLSTALTRVEKGGAIIGILTHWHGDDWAGRIIKNMVTNSQIGKWKIISLQARYEPPIIPEGKTFEEYQKEQMLLGNFIQKADPLGRKPGEPLWPEVYDEEWLKDREIDEGPYEWSALYQQSPYSRIGKMFKDEYFSIADDLPKNEDGSYKLPLARVRVWDKAGTEGGGAYSAGVCMSIYPGKFVYVEHVTRGQWSTYQREEEILKAARQDKDNRPGHTITWHLRDPGSAGLESAQGTNAKLAEAGFEAHFELVTGSKEEMAGQWSSACEAGKVRLLQGGWNQPFIDEHRSFPKGKYKDQVDAGAMAYIKLTKGMALDGQLFF